MSDIDKRIEEAQQLFEQHNFDAALAILEDLSNQKLKKKQKYEVILKRGVVKMNMSRYDEARADLEESLRLAEKNADRYQQTHALHQLGIINKLLGDYQRATELLREELRRCSSLIPCYYADLSYNFYEQGDVMMLAGEYEDAEMYFKHAVTFADTEQNYHGAGLAYRGLAHLQMRFGQTKGVLAILEQSRKNFELGGNLHELEEVVSEIEHFKLEHPELVGQEQELTEMAITEY